MASQCLRGTAELVALDITILADRLAANLPIWCRRDPTTSRQAQEEQEQEREQEEQEEQGGQEVCQVQMHVLLWAVRPRTTHGTPPMRFSALYSSILVRGERQALMPATPGRIAKAVLGAPSAGQDDALPVMEYSIFSNKSSLSLSRSWIIMAPMTMEHEVCQGWGCP